jgi:hypothetical protein
LVATARIGDRGSGGTASRTIRVASVPGRHVYVSHLSDPDGCDGVVRLRDPHPLVATTPLVGQWWPPTMLSTRWIIDHADDFDIFHVHFGFDALDPTALRRVVDELGARGKPLVYTVHDLRNPHHADPAAHDAHLDVLIPAATTLITLTQGAAEVIRRRWQRHAHVLPHPHVVDLQRMRSARPRHGGFIVGVHAKSVRASMDPESVIRALCDLTRDLPGARVQVNLHHDVYDADGLRHDRHFVSYLRNAASSHELDLLVHDCYTDDELWNYLQRLDVSVLPYRFGTHSGWLEACHDLVTTVIAPTCGFFAEQKPCLTYHHDESHLDIDSLHTAVRAAYLKRPSWRADIDARRHERRALAAAHRKLYEQSLA